QFSQEHRNVPGQSPNPGISARQEEYDTCSVLLFSLSDPVPSAQLHTVLYPHPQHTRWYRRSAKPPVQDGSSVAPVSILLQKSHADLPHAFPPVPGSRHKPLHALGFGTESEAD